MNHKSFGIYIHIPFCVRKCLYCDFVSGPSTTEVQINYVNQLKKEICAATNDDIVDTVFIGGGTPSVLDVNLLEEILCKLKEAFCLAPDCEYSMEINPGTVDYDKLVKYRKMGINRLSIGLQSCNDNELKALGRIHDYKTFEETYFLARKAGFENINVDLMSSVPEQTPESFSRSLRKVAELNPEHISVYSLIVEEGTPFYDMELQLPSEEEERLIYHETGRILREYGYEQYEISNYAKKGKECRHNIRYWQCDEYLGFGVAAASYQNGVRRKNTTDMECYLQTSFDALREDLFYEEEESLTQEDQYAEFMFMGLRMNAGIAKDEFINRFGVPVETIYGDVIKKHVKNGLLEVTDQCIRLTERGRDVSNFVMSDFILLD